MMPRPVYIAWRVAESLGQVASRFVNAVFFGGSTRQSVSARAYVENWPKGRPRIDAFFRNLPFWWEEDHCSNAWAAEVDDARKTLDRNSALGVRP